MATEKATRRGLNLRAALESAQGQFRSLNPREPGRWPLLPKVAVWLLSVVVAVVVGWSLVVSSTADVLDREEARERALRSEFQTKLGQAINLAELRRQKIQVQEYVTQLEQQLPGKAEMDALLSDINQAGLGRGLVFDLFRPGQIQLRDYYAELPIAIRVTGKYHDIGSFAAEISNLPRIVTLHDISLSAISATRDVPREGSSILAMEATARTYRYLDPAEVAAQKKPAPAAKGAPK